MTGSRNRILLVAYHFPPGTAVGGARPANFARFLPSFGWDVRVVTKPQAELSHLDGGRLAGLESVPVHHARTLPTFLGLYGALKTRVRRSGSGGDDHSTPVTGVVAAGKANESRLARWKRYVLSFLLIPDYDRGWILPAAITSVRLIREHRIRWLFTTCPPYSSHLVGLLVALATGAKWAADFRDPWMTTGSKRLYPTSRLSLALESRLERMVIKRADLVVFNVERLRNAYRDKYGKAHPGKFVFIPNAAPISKGVLGGAPVSRYSEFTMTYTGTLYAGRSPEPVLKAVADLIAENESLRSRVRIKLVGECSTVDGRPTLEIIRQHGLEGVVEMPGPLPYAASQEIVARSHLALLFAPGLAYQIPAKFYDYLGAGARMLAVAEPGATSDMVKATGSGSSFEPNDIHGIKNFILEQMASPGSAEAQSPGVLEQFQPAKLTGQLVEYIEREEGDVSARKKG